MNRKLDLLDICATWRDVLEARKTSNMGLPVKTKRGTEKVFTIQATERDLDDLAAALKGLPELWGYVTALVDNCTGRLPPDSSDSVTVEAIHVRRLAVAVENLTQVAKSG